MNKKGETPLHLAARFGLNAVLKKLLERSAANEADIKKEEKEVEPVSWTERWDDRIRGVSLQVGLSDKHFSFVSIPIQCP